MPEQIRFVKELTDNITQALIADITAGHIPDDWNGIQLRQLLADWYTRNTIRMKDRDQREYRRMKLLNNL